MGDDLEEMKNEVWGKLAQLTGEELAAMCTGLSLTVPESKKGRKSALYSLILKQLASDEVEEMDEGAEKALFENIKGSIDQMFQIRGVKAEQETLMTNSVQDANAGGRSADGTGGGADVGTTGGLLGNTSVGIDTRGDASTSAPGVNGGGQDSGNSTPSLTQKFATFATSQATLGDNVSRRQEVVRLKREFRIDGTVGTGSKDSLAYGSLCYQMQQGKDSGYTPREIMSAVIRATKQGSLRTYLESQVNISEEDFLQALRIHYNEKKAFKMLNEMSRRYQDDGQALEANENEVQFCMRMFGYCEQIRKISREEGQPMDEKLISETLYSSLSTGFKQGAVRLELQQTLNDCKLDNNTLLKQVTRVMNKEIEHKSKMEGDKKQGDKKQVQVNEVDILDGRRQSERRNQDGDSGGQSREDKIFSAISNLTLQVTELSEMSKKKDAEMQDLKKKLDKCETKLADQDNKPRKVTFKNKCPTCETKGLRFCKHCLTCGSTDHKMKECPENQ